MSAPGLWRAGLAAIVVMALLAVVLATVSSRQSAGAEPNLQQRLAARAPWGQGASTPCPWKTSAPGEKPLVLLVLGQSNAGNHGDEAGSPQAQERPPVTVTDGRSCWRVNDPLPGGTGTHRSIWPLLQPALAGLGHRRDVVISLLAVESTAIDDWTRSSSPLRAQLLAQLRALREAPVDFVLWQQGEADARLGTSAEAYTAAFDALRRDIRGQGMAAPLVVALSTRCRSAAGSGPVRQALKALPVRHADVLPGPDTDALMGGLRVQDCHFSLQGLQAAAGLWAQALALQLR